jgi:hypothetical protein
MTQACPLEKKKWQYAYRLLRTSSPKGEQCDMTAERENSGARRNGIAGHWLGKHLFTSTNAQATTEELLEEKFSMWSIPRLYNKDKQDKSELSCS